MKTKEELIKFMTEQGWRYTCDRQSGDEPIIHCFDKHPKGILLNVSIEYHLSNGEYLATLQCPLDEPVVSISVKWFPLNSLSLYEELFVKYAEKIGIVPNTSNRKITSI